MIKEALGFLRRINWSIVGGPLLTAATAIVLAFLTYKSGFRPESSASLVILIVAFSAFAGGLRPGLASSAISWAYFAFAFSLEGQPFHYDSESLERLVVLAATAPAIVIMVGVLHRRSTTQIAAQLLESEQRFVHQRVHALDRLRGVLLLPEAVHQPHVLVRREGTIDCLGRGDGQHVVQPAGARVADRRTRKLGAQGLRVLVQPVCHHRGKLGDAHGGRYSTPRNAATMRPPASPAP